MKFNFDCAGVPADAREEMLQKLSSYQKRLRGIAESGEYNELESSINLSGDEAMQSRVIELAKEKASGNLRFVIVVGIGGSNLGMKAVYDALGGHYDALSPRRPQLICADTVDSKLLKQVTALFETSDDSGEFLLVIVSKSGRTMETAANASVLFSAFEEKFGDSARERSVVITDGDSPLSALAREKEIAMLSMPKPVGGRFSVLSAVGLFPLACLGIDVEALVRGALEARDRALSEEDNPALESALALAYFHENGYRIHDMFLFDPSLESLGKWYRQLLAESIGKSESAGYTPIVSIGSTDLHSLGQLALAGPKNRVTTFVERKQSETLPVPDTAFSALAENLEGKDMQDILSALQSGAEEAYGEAGLPFMKCVLEDAGEAEIGAFFQWKMIEVMYLGALLGVNTFDQPAVESYKIATRGFLSK